MVSWKTLMKSSHQNAETKKKCFIKILTNLIVFTVGKCRFYCGIHKIYFNFTNSKVSSDMDVDGSSKKFPPKSPPRKIHRKILTTRKRFPWKKFPKEKIPPEKISHSKFFPFSFCDFLSCF